ncbi:MAG: hypothetical protein SNJ59_11830 [Aggregatilineales bacterium]
MGRHLLVAAGYLAVAIISTWPLITALDRRLIGHPFGDSYEYAHHIWWIHHALRTGQPLFFQPLLLYPDGLSALWLWSAPLQSFPAWLMLFAMPLPAAFNLAALLTLALNGWAMWLLASRALVPGRHAAALVAGLVFMLYPTFQGQLAAGHTGLLVVWPLPLYVLLLLRLREGGSAQRIILAGVLLAVSLWGNPLNLIFLVLPITVVFAAVLFARREWEALRRMLAAVVLGLLLAAVFIVPLLLEPSGTLAEEGSVRYSAALFGLVAPSFYHPLFSGLEYPRRIMGVDPFELASYAGATVIVLALLALRKTRGARLWLLLAAGAWVFSLGPLLKPFDAPLTLILDGYPTHIPLPWSLAQNLPVIGIARTPARFNFAIGLALAALAATGAAAILDKIPRPSARALAAVALGGLIAFEYQSFWPLPTVPADIPQPIQQLGQRADIRAVFDVPWAHPLTSKDGLFLQTGHGLPLIGGHITRRTPLDPAKAVLLEQTLDLALLDAAGVDVIILHRNWADSEGRTEARLRAQLGEPWYEDARFAVFEVPAYAGAAPGFITVSMVSEQIDERGELYLYAPVPGVVSLIGTVSAPTPRQAIVTVNGETVSEWTAADPFALNISITLPSAGYHTIGLHVDPPCPHPPDPALACAPLFTRELALVNFVPAPVVDALSSMNDDQLD